MKRVVFAASLLALPLAACGDGDEAAEPAETENVGPQGKVYGGTISDAMLPTVEVQSQSPQRGGNDKKTDEADTSEG